LLYYVQYKQTPDSDTHSNTFRGIKETISGLIAET